jgi:hypothetical protein
VCGSSGRASAWQAQNPEIKIHHERERERERERENEQRDYYSEIKSIIREYHEQLFTNKINNPDELTT